MSAGIEQLLLIVLTGDIDQIAAQLCRQFGGYPLVIDKEAGAPVLVQKPADYALTAGFILQAVFLQQKLCRLV